MDEYIERESLKAEFMNHYASECPAALVLAMIDNQPTADVVEVRRGKWEQKDKNAVYYWRYNCSVCGQPIHDKIKPYNYCPHCGAKMDLE